MKEKEILETAVLGEQTETSEEKKRRETRERVAKFRLKEKLARAHPDVREYAETMMPVKWKDELAKYTRELSETILKELPSLADGQTLREPEAEIVTLLAHLSLALERKYIQNVRNPVGVLFGEYYGDAACSTIIKFVHNPDGLPQSESFTNLYKPMVKAVAKYFKNIPRREGQDEPDDCLLDVRAEAAGTYQLRPEPTKKIAPESIAEPNLVGPSTQSPADFQMDNLLLPVGPVQQPGIAGMDESALRYLEGV